MYTWVDFYTSWNLINKPFDEEVDFMLALHSYNTVVYCADILNKSNSNVKKMQNCFVFSDIPSKF